MITFLVIAIVLVSAAVAIVFMRKSKVNDTVESNFVNQEVELISEMDASAPIELVANVQEKELRQSAAESLKVKKQSVKTKETVKKEKVPSAPKETKKKVELKKAAK